MEIPYRIDGGTEIDLKDLSFDTEFQKPEYAATQKMCDAIFYMKANANHPFIKSILASQFHLKTLYENLSKNKSNIFNNITFNQHKELRLDESEKKFSHDLSWLNKALKKVIDELFDANGNINSHVQQVFEKLGKTDLDKNELLISYLQQCGEMDCEHNAYNFLVKKLNNNKTIIDADFVQSARAGTCFCSPEDLQAALEQHESLLKASINKLDKLKENPDLTKDVNKLIKLGNEQLKEVGRLNSNPRNKMTPAEKLLLLEHTKNVGNLLSDVADNKVSNVRFQKCTQTSQQLYDISKFRKIAGIGLLIIGTLLALASIAAIVSLKFAPIGILGLILTAKIIAIGAGCLGVGATLSLVGGKKAGQFNFFQPPGKITKTIAKSVRVINSSQNINSQNKK